MTIARKIDAFIEKSSWIRKMFEEGARLKAEHGPDNVFDFSLGNPNVPPPEKFHDVLKTVIESTGPGFTATCRTPDTLLFAKLWPNIFQASIRSRSQETTLS